MNERDLHCTLYSYSTSITLAFDASYAPRENVHEMGISRVAVMQANGFRMNQKALFIKKGIQRKCRVGGR